MDDSQPTLPPDAFSAPEGTYTLTPNLFPAAILAPPTPIAPSLAATSGGLPSAGPSAIPGMALNLTPGQRGESAGGFAGASSIMANASAMTGMMSAFSGPVIGAAGFYSVSNAPGASIPPPPTISPWPVRASWVMIALSPPKTGGGGGFGGLLGKGGEKDKSQQAGMTGLGIGGTNTSGSYEPSSHSSDNSTPASSADPMSQSQYLRPGDDPSSYPGTSPIATTGGIASSLVNAGSFLNPGLGRSNKQKLPPRPKNSIRTTNSTFITRVSSHDQFNKLIATPTGFYDPSTFNPSATTPNPNAPPFTPQPSNLARWAIVNSHRSIIFVSIDVSGKTKDHQLMRVNFSNNVTCHAICEMTKSGGGDGGNQGGDGDVRLDVMIGFATGDLVFLDPIVGKYNRLNKGGIIHNSPVHSIRYHPYYPTIFYVLHQDGLMFVYSTERDDPNIGVASPPPPWMNGLQAFRKRASAAAVARTAVPSASSPSIAFGAANLWDAGQNEAIDQRDEMFVWKNDEPVDAKGKGASPWGGKNPVAVWRIGSKNIKQFEFSPDGQSLAAVSDDGTLRVIDVGSERVLDTYDGYFGALNCVAWSPDGRFIITGGQDDLITIFSPRESRVVARCQGHSSFVTNLAFDRRRCNARGYRFGSVGEDGRVLLWDFSSASLQRPRQAHAQHHRVSLGSTISVAAVQAKRSTQLLPVEAVDSNAVHYHPAPPRNEVAMLQPVMVKLIESSIVTAIDFFPDAVTTISRTGSIRFWTRPAEKSRTNTHASRTEDLALKMKGMKVANGGRKERDAVSVQG